MQQVFRIFTCHTQISLHQELEIRQVRASCPMNLFFIEDSFLWVGGGANLQLDEGMLRRVLQSVETDEALPPMFVEAAVEAFGAKRDRCVLQKPVMVAEQDPVSVSWF